MRKKVKKTQSVKLEEAELPPKKGDTTFSAIDGMGVRTERGVLDRIADALERDKKLDLELTIADERDPPNVVVRPEITVEPPKIDIRPPQNNIDVKPTPVNIDVKVPIQKTPLVTIKNQIPVEPLFWAVGAIIFFMAIDVGLKIWQLLM